MTNEMTAEEAVKILKEQQAEFNETWIDYGRVNKAYNKAIKALETQPKPMEKFDDVKTHIQRLAGDYKCWDNRLTWEEALELNRMLEAQPSEDCISRQAVLDVITFEDKWLYDAKSHNADTHIAFSSLESRVKALPSVTPQRPKGKWIKVITNIDEWGETWHFKCSICGEKSNKGYRPLENYCHNCGAEMDGGAE